jgi:prepilin-type N-terminal cleavage/methylation domain-containing protein
MIAESPSSTLRRGCPPALSTPPSARPTRTWGFTLLELLLVMLVVGILGALAALGLARQSAQAQNVGFVDNLAQDINQARSLAMARGRVARVTFVSATRYTVTLPPRSTVAGDPAVNLIDRQNSQVSLSGVNPGDRLDCSSLGYCLGSTASGVRRSLSSISGTVGGQLRVLDITVLGLTRLRK